MTLASRWIILCLVTFAQSHKVGLLFDEADKGKEDGISRMIDYTISKLDTSTNGIEVQVKYHGSTILSVHEAVCSLLELGVVAVVTASGSTMTEVEENILNEFQVPVLATYATNPYLHMHQWIVFLIPSDTHQNTAIFDLLKEYRWYEFSIIASADEYGINGVLHLQNLASQNNAFTVRHVQHFDTQDENYLFATELSLIKEELVKVVVLNCRGEYAKRIFRYRKTQYKDSDTL